MEDSMPRKHMLFVCHKYIDVSRYLLTLLLLMTVLPMTFFAQGVIVSNDSSAVPEASAMFEVRSVDKGMLLPRMTTAQRDAIASPAPGLAIFNTTTNCLEYYTSIGWMSICGCSAPPVATITSPDSSYLNITSISVSALLPPNASGQWLASGGSFANPSSPTTTFSGSTGVPYTLIWTVTNNCGADSDTISVDFNTMDGVYVSVSGDDSNPGTPASPLKTIAAGITKTQSYSYSKVYVSEGTYAEQVQLVAGINLYGGYQAGTWTHAPATYTTTIQYEETAMKGESISSTTIVDGFTIDGTASASTENIYSLYLKNCSSVQVTDCIIKSGNGKAGTTWTYTAVPGTNGSNGTNGGLGKAEGGSPPVPGSGYGAAGDGGSPGLGMTGGSSGASGADTGGGAGGNGGLSGGTASSGGDGANGQDGAHGANGSGGASFGSINATGLYQIAPDGGLGGNGQNGGSGGGGGGQAGGYIDNPILPDELVYGGAGGGGGSAGTGAEGGAGGGSGYGSFAVWLISSSLSLSNSSIITGKGGDGGNGVDGGTGGTGGSGGTGGLGPDMGSGGVGHDGNGGDGGDGGMGGNGGGGGGGPSIGIVKVSGSSVTKSNVTFTIGAGGTGGTAGRGYGNDGATGLTAQEHTP